MTYGKPSSARVFLMLFLSRWWRKLIAYLMQKSWGGIHAFLGKIMLYCDYNKDSVFNFSSSRVPKSRQIYLAWAKLLVAFDFEVTRTGRLVFSAGCKVIHIVCSACFTLKGRFFPIWVSYNRLSLFQVQPYTGEYFFFQFSVSVKHFEAIQLKHWFFPAFIAKVG